MNISTADSSAVRLTNSDPQGRYKIIKEIIADPHHPVVLMRVRLEGDERLLSRMKAYALLAPHLDVGGAGNSGSVLDLAGKRVLLAYKNGISLVMAASCGFSRASCGYVGSSDGWQDLMDNFHMDWEFGSASDGNIALTGEIDISSEPRVCRGDCSRRGASLRLDHRIGRSDHALRAEPEALYRAMASGRDPGGFEGRRPGCRTASANQPERHPVP